MENTKGNFDQADDIISTVSPIKIRPLHPDEILDTMNLIDFDAPVPEVKATGPKRSL